MLPSNKSKTILLNIARRAIDVRLSGGSHDSRHDQTTCVDPALQQNVGCFVTLKIAERLRGCLGNFTSQQPLYLEVAKTAVAAATKDPRFPAMTQSDIGTYQLDISVLSPLKRIDDIALIEVGTHGIYLIKEANHGVLLPQVATEQGWDRQTFLEQTSIKAGLPPEDWQSPQTKVYIFSAQILTEQESNGI